LLEIWRPYRETDIQNVRTKEAVAGYTRNWGAETPPSAFILSANYEEESVSGGPFSDRYALYFGYRRTFRRTDDFVSPATAKQRIERLVSRAHVHGLAFRRSFVGDTVELVVERNRVGEAVQHGRCPRYYDVHFEHAEPLCGRIVRVKIDRVTPTRTHGTLIDIEPETFR